MPNLLTSLEKRNLLLDYTHTIDWYLNGGFYRPNIRWTAVKKSSFTKRVKNDLGIRKKQNKDAGYEPCNHRSKKKKYVYTVGNGEGESLLKHIRNGIAHGNCELFFPGRTPFIEIKDFTDETRRHQTAYIYMPLENLKTIVSIYKQLD